MALFYGIDFAGYVGDPDGFLAREREVLAASGIAGGLVYWLFAGRRAGSVESERMNKAGLAIALLVAIVVGGIFAAQPKLDIDLARFVL